MGGNVSKQEILNETLSSTAIDVMTKNSKSISGSTTQSNELNLSGNKGNLNAVGLTQSNAAKINLKSLTSTESNAKLQADLQAKLKSAAETQAPSLAIASDTTQEVTNKIKQIISVSMSTENLTQMDARIEQKNTIDASNNEGNINLANITQSNTSEIIMEEVTKMSSEIVEAVKATGEIDSSASQKQAGILPDTGQLIVIGIIVVAVVLLGGGKMFNDTLNTMTKPVPMAFAAMVVLILVWISLNPPAKKTDTANTSTFGNNPQEMLNSDSSRIYPVYFTNPMVKPTEIQKIIYDVVSTANFVGSSPLRGV